MYTKLSDGKILRELTTFDRKMLMDRYYYPYHRAFKMQVQKILEAFGFCLIIDCHSFPSRPLPYEMDQDPARSDICIGTDTYHSPKNFTDILVKFFKSEGFSVAVNKPFAGTIVPVEFYRKKPEVQSLMIEINRRLYMNEDTGARINSFDSAKQSISRLFQNLKEIFLSQPGPMGKLNGTMSGGKGLTL